MVWSGVVVLRRKPENPWSSKQVSRVPLHASAPIAYDGPVYARVDAARRSRDCTQIKEFLGLLRFGGCFEKPSLQALFWCKKLRSWHKRGKVTKRRRSVKPTCANGGTNRANSGTKLAMQVSVHREIFNFSWRLAKSVLSSTVRR